MKHFYNSIILILLLFIPFILYSSEYYPIHNISSIELHFNLSQQITNSLPHFNFRTRQINNMLQHYSKQQLPDHHNSINSNQCNMSNVSQSLLKKENLSAAIKSQRNEILKQFMANDSEIPQSCFKKHSISSVTKQYLRSDNIDLNALEFCNGNTLQHAIHQEFMTLTDATAHIWNQSFYDKEKKELTSLIGNFIDAGISFNHAGETKKALALADAGWALFDCVLAVGEGVIEGISSIAHDIIHPIQTVQIFSNAAISCGYYLAVALQEVSSIAESLIFGNFDIAHNKYNVWSKYCKSIAYALEVQSKNLTAHDAIKTITSSLIQCYATTRAINGFSTFFNNAQQSAMLIAKKINEGVQESTLLMSAEGIPLRLAQEILKQIKKIPRAQDNLLKVLIPFNGQIIKVGKVTCLLDKRGLKHILQRHHPKYWNGSLKDFQTFLPANITIPNIIDIIKQVIKQNKKIVLRRGTNGKYQVDGIIKNIRYRVGFKNGRIAQFYIPFKQ